MRVPSANQPEDRVLIRPDGRVTPLDGARPSQSASYGSTRAGVERSAVPLVAKRDRRRGRRNPEEPWRGRILDIES